MTWQLASFTILGLGLAVGFAWYERSAPSARVLSLVAALAALAVVGRLAFAAFPNVKPTTDIVLLAGYALGGPAGFAVGAITPLASNVFLGHGPWTPWQMAAWGGVGIAGAFLARATRGRELGRWQLAAACGVAGAGFGAVMDTYQWTLAAEQNTATWVAVSGTSLPYNLAHVVGNVVFCALVGPAFLRALTRYRRRFEVRWAPAAASAAVLLLLVAPAGASAASAADRATAWLERAQNRDGGFGSAPGQASGALFTGWASLGLAAGERNPRDVERGGRSPIDFTRGEARRIRDVGEIERTILVLEVAGVSPRDFGGRDLVARLERYRRDDGSFSGFVSYTAFGILALRAADAGGMTGPARWLAAQQNEDGGFGVAPNAQSDVDNTGSALQGLRAAGAGRGDAVEQAVAYLRRMQNPDGGFGQSEGRSSNAQSTAYAVQGLVAARRDPGRFRADGRSPLGYLRSLQRRDGRIDYSRTSSQTPVWVTAQAVMALERKPLPIATVPRRRRARSAESRSDTAAAAATRPEPPRADRRRKKRGRAAGERSADAREPTAVGPPGTGGAGWTAYAPVDEPASPVAEPRGSGPDWLGVAATIVLAALAAWAGSTWRTRRADRSERALRFSAKTVASQANSLPKT
ncbi:MAG: energy-coupling factor transport system substrate-specific component [Thermoleophilaceae bacterium]|nr:energy-coupling factor transport system substrate-specific component [Thermoleophilaceae bacterium]